ncbi:Replication factor-A carboxy-terminal domain protein [Arachis hypogaea]|uniref:Replication factor-A carboxy-terminal domain protein n=1 Tax=Arachis hypogaea TaxID=3818 RepID=A0A6B9VFM8_ARAHY|nr:Replication factor-A carboxy-terminal domain protein [Arachis hypogaea]
MLGMNNRVDLVEKITPWRESWKVHVKVVKLWYHKNPALDPSQNLLHMVLMDEKFRLLFQYKTSVVSVVSPRIPHSDFVGIITGVRKERDVASYGKLIKAVVLEVFTDGGVILQNVINVSRLFINPDISESVEFLSRFSVASYGFSRLVTNDLRYLVSKVDGDYFNPKEISNIQDLHADNGDSHYFVIGTIKEVMEEPDLWYYSCVCDHAIVEHEDLYLCDVCGSCVEHVMVKYGIRVKIHHGGCAILFVLLDNAATKLFGKTCSEAFLRIEEEFPVDHSVLAVCRSYSPQIFDDVVGEEKVFKVEIHSAVDPDYSGCFKIVNVFSHNPEPAATDDYINARLHGPIFPPIYDTYLQYATGEYYKTQVGGFVFILVTISFVLKNHKWWFSTCLCGSLVSANKNILSCDLCQLQCIDAVPRPVGYEMNRSVYIVQQIWDDTSVINVFEAAAEMNEHKIHVLVDSMPEVEDAFSQCESDHEAIEDLHAF